MKWDQWVIDYGFMVLPPPQTFTVLTVAEAADFLKMSVETLRHRTNPKNRYYTPDLPVFRIGTTRRFILEDLLAYRQGN